MKTVYLLSILMGSLVSVASANIGDTPEVCALQFGKPESTQKNPDGDCISYTKNGFDIFVTFENNKAKAIQYGPTGNYGKMWSGDGEMDAKVIEALLKESFKGEWIKTSAKENLNKEWETPDGTIEANFNAYHNILKVTAAVSSEPSATPEASHVENPQSSFTEDDALASAGNPLFQSESCGYDWLQASEASKRQFCDFYVRAVKAALPSLNIPPSYIYDYLVEFYKSQDHLAQPIALPRQLAMRQYLKSHPMAHQ